MASQYPAIIDNTITLPTALDTVTPVFGAAVNLLRDAIIRIETELGIKPSTIYGTVRNRLDYLESITTAGGGGGGGGGTNFVAGGDLSGSAVYQTVTGLRGVAIASNFPTTNEVLLFNGSSWTPSVIPVQTATGTAGGDLSGTYPNPTVAKLQGHAVTSTAPSTSQALIFNGTAWAPTTIPAQTATGTAGGDLSGAYPNPTVAHLQGFPVSSTMPTDNQVLTWSATDSSWEPKTYVPYTSVTTVNALPYNTLSTDVLLAINYGFDGYINLEAFPSTGRTVSIKDTFGAAGTNNIQINGNGHTIDGDSGYLLSVNYGEVSLVFTGSEWSIV